MQAHGSPNRHTGLQFNAIQLAFYPAVTGRGLPNYELCFASFGCEITPDAAR